jgi:hypothetical protein
MWNILHVVSRPPSYHKYLLHSFRNDTNVRVAGIPGATQQRYNTWPEAHEAYVNAYEGGTVRATPIVNGPFDPYAEGDDADLASAFTRLVV